MIFDIIGLLVIGLIIGAIARLLKRGRQGLGIGGTLVLGVVGALIGGFLASLIGKGDIFELNFVGFVLAVIAAFLLVGVAEATVGKNKGAVHR